jgi:acetyl-CoA carboxylase biotin carboxyl carrier protein
MDIKHIKRLIKLVETSSIEELEIQEENFQVRITKGSKLSGVPMIQDVHMIQPGSQRAMASHVEASVHESKSDAVSKKVDENTVEICSPMVGTFYWAPAPDANPYVKEGDEIHPGKVLCIIEAMKLMNEIEAEISGKIIKVLAENGKPVEYNQPLFLVKKS